MLKNIALIASIISGITAVTTSLRALGKSRENARHELESRIKTGCRVGDYTAPKHAAKRSGLLVHLISTSIWFVLSVIFAATLIEDKDTAGLVQGILPFLFLIVLLGFIWWKATHPEN